MPAGRPSKYDPAMCDVILQVGEDGGTLAEMAASLDIDRGTLNEWAAKHEEFSRAIKKALLKAQVWWERQGKIATFGGIDGYNATSYIFQMKNRFKEDWRDKQEIEHTVTTLGDALDALDGPDE